MRQKQMEAGAARALDDVREERCAEPAPLQVGADDETELRRPRLDPGDGSERKYLARQVESADGLDLAVVKSEQAAERLAVTQRRRTPEPQADVQRIQQPPELDTAQQVAELHPPDPHGAEPA